jgi:hypothetical protein
MTLSIKGLYATFSIMTLRIATLSITTLSIMTLCHYAECRCAECCNLFIVMLNVIMPSVITLSVVMLNVIMLSVIAPFRLDWKGLPRTNTLAYYKNPQFTAVKSFIGLPADFIRDCGQGWSFLKLLANFLRSFLLPGCQFVGVMISFCAIGFLCE